jgi:dynein heavy chain
VLYVGVLATGDRSIDNRKTFSTFFKSLARSIKWYAFIIPSSHYHVILSPFRPEQGVVLDYFIDPTSGDAVPWQSKMTSSMPAEFDAGTVMVPTVDTVRLTYLLNLLVHRSRPVMFVGSSGTGKTILISGALRSGFQLLL